MNVGRSWTFCNQFLFKLRRFAASAITGEGKSGTLRNVEQTVAPVRQVQYPQECHLPFFRMRGSAYSLIEAAATELRLALWLETNVEAILLKHGNDFAAFRQRISQRFWSNKIEIVGRRMILGELSMG